MKTSRFVIYFTMLFLLQVVLLELFLFKQLNEFGYEENTHDAEVAIKTFNNHTCDYHNCFLFGNQQLKTFSSDQVKLLEQDIKHTMIDPDYYAMAIYSMQGEWLYHSLQPQLVGKRKDKSGYVAAAWQEKTVSEIKFNNPLAVAADKKNDSGVLSLLRQGYLVEVYAPFYDNLGRQIGVVEL